MLEYIIELVGEDKVALGTDYPFPLGELSPGKLIHDRPYPNNVKEKLLSNNALDWLNMKKEDFI